MLLGNTNLSEWANFGGAPDRNPCDSSSRSGAAIAAELAVVAVGTETGWLHRLPEQCQRHRRHQADAGPDQPQWHVPIAASQDTAGPMAHHVSDAALLLQVRAGSDAADPATQAPPAGLSAQLLPRPCACSACISAYGVIRPAITTASMRCSRPRCSGSPPLARCSSM